MDIGCLSEHNRRENEQLEKERKKREEAREHPGMERYDDPEDFWAEAERANRED